MARKNKVVVMDDRGVMVSIEVDEKGRVGEAQLARLDYRHNLHHDTFVGQMLVLLAAMPDVHPFIKAKLIALENTVAFYIPVENGGKMRWNDPLPPLIDTDDDLPF